MNPVAVVLILLGLFLLVVGFRGNQTTLFNGLAGHQIVSSSKPML